MKPQANSQNPPELCINRMRKEAEAAALPFSCEDTKECAKFFAAINSARPTPLVSLKRRAANLGLGAIYVKDESPFMGLNAFKARGAVWAIAKICSRKAGLPAMSIDLPPLQAALAQAGHVFHFVTATDGNHGVAVAFGARLLGQKAIIFMPKGAPQPKIGMVRKLGAICKVTELDYDDTVRAAADFARDHNAELVQDTAWPGYVEIPAAIMQGYAAIARETIDELGGQLPTHILVQVGVGSFAGAMVSAFTRHALQNSAKLPLCITLEPAEAASLHRSLAEASHAALGAPGNLKTVMAGLSCGELNSLAWPILRDNVYAAMSCPDYLALRGMDLLTNPLAGDRRILSGESGAIGMGALEWLVREKMGEIPGLGPDASILIFSTEGPTD